MAHSQFDDEEHITTSSDQRLVYMANQIAKFFAAQPRERAVKGVAKHIADFWDPRMREHIRAHVEAGGAGLDVIAREAVRSLDR